VGQDEERNNYYTKKRKVLGEREASLRNGRFDQISGGARHAILSNQEKEVKTIGGGGGGGVGGGGWGGGGGWWWVGVGGFLLPELEEKALHLTHLGGEGIILGKPKKEERPS